MEILARRNCFPTSATHLGQDFLLKHILLELVDESVTNGRIEQVLAGLRPLKAGVRLFKIATPWASYEESSELYILGSEKSS